MAYGRGDIPKFKAPRLPRMPEDRRTNLAPGGPLPTKPKPKPVPKPAAKAKPKPQGGVPAPPEAGTPYDAYIEELRKMKGEEVARQQAEANRIRQAYAAYAAYVKDLPDRVQALYSNAGHDQAQFANGFANGLRETAAAQAAEINAQLAKIGAPEGQQVDASQGEQAGNVLYGVGGYIPAQALTTSGAAYGSAAAFEGPNALKKGLLESQKFITDNAGRVSDFDMEIAKIVGQQAQYRAELKAAEKKQTAQAKQDAAELRYKIQKDREMMAYRWATLGLRQKEAILRNRSEAKRIWIAMKNLGLASRRQSFSEWKGQQSVAQADVRLQQGNARVAISRANLGLAEERVRQGWDRLTLSEQKSMQKKDKARFTPIQISRFKRDAADTARDAWLGINEPDLQVAPKSYGEAYADMVQHGIPGWVAQNALNRYWKRRGFTVTVEDRAAGNFNRWQKSQAGRPLKDFAPPPKGGAARGGRQNASYSDGRAPSIGGSLIGTPYSGTHTLGNWESDNAIDVSLKYGSPLYAVEDGVIGPQFGSLGSSGRFAGLRLHLVSRGNEYYYAHLSRFVPGLRPGMRVKKGQLIGYSGSANGVNHLHFGQRRGDPRSFYGGGNV